MTTRNQEAPTGAPSDSMREIPDALNAYWPSRIHEDRIMYGEFITDGAVFFAPNTHTDSQPHVYRMTDIQNNGDTFTLTPCAVRDPVSGVVDTPVSTPDTVDTVCDLAGALELGELIHLPEGVLTPVRDTSFLPVGETVIAIADNDPDLPQSLTSLDQPQRNPHSTRDSTVFNTGVENIDSAVQLFIPQTQGHDTVTDYISVQPFSKWTFEDTVIREWTESVFEPGDRVLNACAGKTRLTPPENGEIIRNDVNPDRDADLHVDVGELAAHLDKESFDVIVFDPPWSLYQSNLRYDGNHVRKTGDIRTRIDLDSLPFETPDPSSKSQLGHARLAKENFHWLLKPRGKVVQITFHGTAMPARLQYTQNERVIFDPVGEAKSVIGSIDQKTTASTTESLLNISRETSEHSNNQQTLSVFNAES